jgi:RND family efflux transporter MFP subunit
MRFVIHGGAQALLAFILFPLFSLLALADDYVGLVHPTHELTLSIGVGGMVSKINVQRGQSVKARQVLLVLDDRMQAIEVNRRQVVLDDNSELTATRDRVRALKIMHDDTRRVFDSTGSISRDEMSKLEVEYSTARGRLLQLEAQKLREKLELDGALQERAMRNLTSPVAGVITRIEPKVGEWAKPGEPMMMLVDASVCYLTVNVPLTAVSALRSGMTLPVRFEASAYAAPVKGKITFVSSVADAASGLVEIRVAFANPGLQIRPGIKGMIDLPLAGAKP